jgi:pimeloyl-ACP methyl ester carboxylesterase
MRNLVPPVRPLTVAAAVLALLGLAGTAAAQTPAPPSHLVYFKDGYVLRGRVIQEKKSFVDSYSGQEIELRDGFFLVDDGARKILFSPAQVKDAVEDKNFDLDATPFVGKWYVEHYDFDARPMPFIRTVEVARDWNEKWVRDVVVNAFSAKEGERRIRAWQTVASMNLTYVRLDCIPRQEDGKFSYPYAWRANYATKELGPDQVLALINLNPEYNDHKGLKDEERRRRRLKAAQFLADLGWCDKAEAELKRLQTDLPDQKEAINTAFESLKKIRSIQLARDIRVADKAGRFQWAQKQLTDFAGEGVPEKTLSDLRELKEKYATAADNAKQAKQYLDALSQQVGGRDRQLFTEAAETIVAELNPGNVDRLKTFITQAAQAERLKANPANKTPILLPQQLLSFAVTGWVLGDVASEERVDVALKLWKARKLALAYQVADGKKRADLLDEYLTNKSDTVGVDEMAQVVASLPPPEPEEDLSTDVRVKKTDKAGRKATSYHLQVPPEYSHSHPTPVLLVLHGDKSPSEELDRWADEAGKHGYLVAAPEWGGGEYGWSSDEQAPVLQTLRDLKRHFNVDSDRVFVTGFGAGASLAWDLGQSHPDLFAGVAPISAEPNVFAFRYRRNCQYLPYYVVNGEKAGDRKSNHDFSNKDFFQDWIIKGFPSVYVQYRGRGQEWFSAEVPQILEWMDAKKRLFPDSECGKPGDSFTTLPFVTMRRADNSFYWLSADEMNSRQLNEDLAAWNPKVTGVRLQAAIGKNQISVTTESVTRLSVWLSTQHHIDYEQPVTVILNNKPVPVFSKKVKPSLQTLLDDLAERGDRQRLFVARLEFKP